MVFHIIYHVVLFLTIQPLQGFQDFLLCLCALVHVEKWPQICFPVLGKEELWKQHLWVTFLAFHVVAVLKNTLLLSKILKFALYYRAPTEFVFTTYIWIYYFSGKPYSSFLSELPEPSLNTGRTITISFILIRQRVLFLIEKWKTYLQKRNTSREYRWQTWHLEYFCFPPFIEFVSCRCGRMFQT